MKDQPDVLVPEGTRHALRRMKAPPITKTIMGDWSGSDSAGNSVGVGDDASGNANAGSDAAGW